MALDESLREDIICVAGVMLPVRGVAAAIERWHTMKAAMGLDPADEVKHSMQPRHPSRQKLDELGWTQAVRIPYMLDVVGELDVLVIANTLVDRRTIGEGKAVDFYINAFDWCLRRFANHIQLTMRYQLEGPHLVVVDMPPDPGDIHPVLRPRILDLVKGMSTAAFEHYQHRYLEDEVFPSGNRAPSLRSLGFAPTLAATHARYSDLHQISDVVAGAVSEFCHFNLTRADGSGRLPDPTYREENLRRVAHRIRRGSYSLQLPRYGFGLWPQNEAACRPLIERVEAMCRGESV